MSRGGEGKTDRTNLKEALKAFEGIKKMFSDHILPGLAC